MRGNDVYRGVIRNASQPGSKSVTIVIELTKSKDEAKQSYDKAVAEQTSAGYVFDSAGTANFKAFEKSANVDIGEAWFGVDSAGHSFLCATENDPQVGTFGTWLFITQAGE
jgi:Flp pilus assembly protein TadG